MPVAWNFGKSEAQCLNFDDPICALCGREIPKGVPQSQHHLIPKLKGGKGGATVLLHHQCHKEIQHVSAQPSWRVTITAPSVSAAIPTLQSL